MEKVILTGLTAAVMSATAMASEVTGYTAPQSGQAATAAGVDANFQALISAINDNNDRIAALEDAAGTGGSLEDKISGATFNIVYLGSIIGTYQDQSSSNYGYLEGFAGSSLLTLETDGTITEVWQEALREIGLERVSDCVEVTDEFGGSYSECSHAVYDEESGPETNSGGAWQLNGNVLSVTFPGEDSSEDFMVTMSGEVLVLGSGGHEVDGNNDDYENSMAIGVRTPDSE
jgi:hypothetical protein